MTHPSDGVQDKAADTGMPSVVTSRPSAPDVGRFTPTASPTGVTAETRIEPDEPDTWNTKPLPPDELVPPVVMWILTLLFAVIVIVAIDIVLSIWPPDATSNSTPTRVPIFWGQTGVYINANDRLMLIAILMGVIGAMVHAMTSFADFVGNRRLARSWLPWYFVRPMIGGGLALFFYVGVRAGFLTTSTASQSDINPFGIAAIGGLAGMFSKQATDKLNEIFSTMFKTSTATGDQQRGGKLGPNAPTRPTGTTTS